MKKYLLLILILICAQFIVAQQFKNQQEKNNYIAYGDTTEQGLVKMVCNLIDKSEIIMDAEIISKESKWTLVKDEMFPDGIKEIHSILTFKVYNWIKGPITGDEVKFLCKGGKIGDTVMTFSSAPNYRMNNRNIYCFFNKEPNTYIKLSGMIPISTTSDGKHAMVSVGIQTTRAEVYVKQLQKAVADFTTYEKYIHRQKMQERDIRIRKQKIKDGTWQADSISNAVRKKIIERGKKD